MLTHKEKLASVKKSFEEKDMAYGRNQVNVLFEEISLLEAELKELRAVKRHVRHYLTADDGTYEAYLKLCQVCGVQPEEKDTTDELIEKLQAENNRLRVEIDAYDKYIRGYLSLGQLEEALKKAMRPHPQKSMEE